MVSLETVKRNIQQCGVSVKDISKLTGVHENTIRAIIRGEDVNPRYDTYEALVNFCNKEYKFSQERKIEILEKSLSSDAIVKAENLAIMKCQGITKIPGQTLVYALVKGGVVVYVGQSRSGLQRPMTHSKEKDFDSIFWIESDEKDLNEIESLLILKMQPKMNGRRKDGSMCIPSTNGFFVENSK